MAKVKTNILPSRLSMAEAAKEIGTGRNKLVKFLKEHGLLQENRMPVQEWIDNGVFAYKESMSGDKKVYVPLVKREGLPTLRTFYESKQEKT